MKLSETSTFVCGGASGLGAAVVKNFLAAGAKVTVFDLPKEGSQEQVMALGEKVFFQGGDVTDPASVQGALEQAKKRWDTPRVVVNCAGIALAQKVIDRHGKAADLNVFKKIVEVNLIGTYNLCRLAAELLIQSEALEEGERGVIINTASIAAFEGQRGQSAYAASKGGVASLILPLARDLCDWGIRVMGIAPGIFDTPMMALLPEEARISLGKQVPFPPRLGRPEEFASLVRQIVENTMLNGTVLRLDGALRMGLK